MNKLVVLLCIISISFSGYSQELRVLKKYLDISLNQALVSYEPFSYLESQSTDKFQFQSAFSPKFSLEFRLDKGGKFQHGLCASMYNYSLGYNLEVPDIWKSNNVLDNSTLVGFYDSYDYSVYSLEYSLYYTVYKRMSVFARLGFEFLAGRKNLNTSNTTYYAVSSVNNQQYYSRVSYGSKPQNITQMLVCSMGETLYLGSNFSLLIMLELKPFSQTIVEQKIKYNEDDIDEFEVDIFRKFINASIGLKYQIPISK
jgi:hypothetical protein